MSIFHFHLKNTKETSKLWHSLMSRMEGKNFSMKTKLRKVQKMTILAYLKILYEGSCWEQLDKGWHSPTSAGSPSSPDANPFPDDSEGDVLQPWRIVIITIATLWETRSRQTQRFSVTKSQGSSSTRSSKLPSPCLCGWDGHRRSPCNRPTGPACTGGTTAGQVPWARVWDPQRRTEESQWAGALGLGKALLGPREHMEPWEQWRNSLFPANSPGQLFSYFAWSLWFLHLPLCPSSPSWEEILARALYPSAGLCSDSQLEIRACWGAFSNIGLFLGKGLLWGKGKGT